MRENFEKYSGPINALIASSLSLVIIYSGKGLTPWLEIFQIFPIATLFVSEGWIWTLLATAIIGVSGSLLISPIEMGLTMLYLMPASICLGLLIKNRSSFFHEIMLTSLILLASVFAQAWIAESISGASLVGALKELLSKGYDEMLEPMMKEIGNIQAIPTEYEYSRAVDLIIGILPTMLFLSGMLSVLISSLISHAILIASGKDVERYALADFELGRYLASALLLAIILGYAFKQGSNTITIIFNNAVVLAGGLFFINGLAYLDHKLKIKGLKAILRVFIYIILSVLMFGIAFAVIMGLIESTFTLRANDRKREDSDAGSQ